MREILFRGKTDDGEWVYGSFCMDAREQFNGLCGVDGFIRLYDKAKGKMQTYEVDRETVGQYTGLKDKNGKRIFEGDIVNLWLESRTYNQADEFEKYKAVIEFGNPNFLYSWGWQLKMIDNMPFNNDILLWVDMEETGAYIEVIGNVHDNPELLEK